MLAAAVAACNSDSDDGASTTGSGSESPRFDPTPAVQNATKTNDDRVETAPAASAAAELLAQLADPATRDTAVDVVREKGSAVVPELVAALDDTDWQVRAGAAFTAVALPVDVNGNPIAGGEIEIAAPGGEVHDRAPTDIGSQRIGATLRTPGVARLSLTDRTNGIRTVSNPIRVLPRVSTGQAHHDSVGQAYNVYWGEFHWHGYDGVELNVLNSDTHPDKAFRYGRDVSRLDFCASSSHIFRHSPSAVHEWWELYRAAAQKYDQPGRYLPFLGCEWRDVEREGGDRNLIWRDLDAPVPDPTWKIGRIYDLFRNHPAMVTPHVGGAIAMPYQHDPDVERLCEMVSGHGQFEWFAQAN
jgi:hypothetical protein